MNEALLHISEVFKQIQNRLNTEILGQEKLTQNLVIAIFSGGHTLLEGTPWLGKTRTIRALANIFSLDHKRISFTPDLLPSDLIGAEIFRPHTGNFEIRKWPIFTNILLADEINRTPPKVQSALLEAMEERQVTIGNETISLPQPFFVFATQNPLENEGTYPLPEAQLDRFFMKIQLSHPNIYHEKRILSWDFTSNDLPLLSGAEIREIQNFIKKSVKIDEKIIDYIARILAEYRQLTKNENIFAKNEKILDYGPSTRAGLALVSAARVYALLNERDYVLPQDIKALIPEILHHRIGLSYAAFSENISKQEITDKILDNVAIL